MGSPVDVVPGEIIEAEWGNTIRDQSISRWPDATARDVGIPIPEAGKVVWLNTPGTLEVYDGAEWVGIDILYGGPFIPFSGTTELTGSLEFAESQTQPNPTTSAGGLGVYFSSGAVIMWSGDRAGSAPNAVPRVVVTDGPNAATLTVDGAGNRVRLRAGGASVDSLVADIDEVLVNDVAVGDGTNELQWRFTRADEGLRVYANNTGGTSILEYLRINKAGGTPRVSYRSAASTSTATANATWFTSNEITSGSRSIGQAALAQSDHIAPATLAELDPVSDPVVSALASVPIRRAAYAPGYLVAGDPREGVAHPMILADELEAIAPEMVDRLPVFDEDGTPGPDDVVVNGPVMTAALLAYVRSLEERIATLESSP